MQKNKKKARSGKSRPLLTYEKHQVQRYSKILFTGLNLYCIVIKIFRAAKWDYPEAFPVLTS